MEKKEIGKLLELLNEYHHFNSDLIGYFYDEEYEKFYFRTELPEEDKEKLRKADALIDDGINEVRVENERICSKRFGFIQRLVEQDKIDRDKIGFKKGLSGEYDNGIAFVHNYDNDTYKVSEFYSPYLQLLMLLSISEQPIEDLISYLK